MARIFIGCCGFRISRKKYYETFDTVEIQETFYNLPSLERVRKWGKEAPAGFVFAMKAWQVITHPSTSPTWRRIRRGPAGKAENYGHLKPTEENIKAWEDTLEVARALGARIIVIQLPPRMELSNATYKQVSEFLSRIQRDDTVLVIEPRHKSWHTNPDAVRSLLKKHSIVHCVDILKRAPVETGEIFYVRLHGLGGELNYKYKYTDKDLNVLKDKVLELKDRGKDVYVMFNNIYMVEDAKRFMMIVKEAS